MKTTVLDCLPWLANKLTDKELSELDNYVDESIDDAIDSIDWYTASEKFEYEINEVIDRHIAGVAKNLQNNGPWRYHDEHNHMGPLSMCEDDACAMVADLTDALYVV